MQGGLVLSGVVVARSLGAENRGYLQLMALIPLVLSQLGMLGLPSSITFYIAQDPAGAREILSGMRGYLLGSVLAVTAVHAVILFVVFGHASTEILLAAIATLGTAAAWTAQSIGIGILQGLQRFHACNLLRSVQIILYGALATALLVVGVRDLTAIAIIWSGTTVFGGAVSLFVALRGLPQGIHAVKALPRLPDVIRFGIKSMPGLSSPIESFRVDQFLVGALAGPAALGLYVVAFAFTTLPRFVAQSIGLIAYPQIAANMSRSLAITVKSLALTAGVVGLIIAALAICSGWLIPTFFGAEFHDAIVIMRITLLSAFLLSIDRVLNDCARGMGRPGLGFVAEVASWIPFVPCLLIIGSSLEGIVWSLAVTSGVNVGVLATLLANALLGTQSSDELYIVQEQVA
jgi:O-antigen/teichoic acid export membrane protein